MSDKQGSGWKINANDGVLERLMSAYGVKTQADLAGVLGIEKHSVTGWVQRDAVPGNTLVRCCIDTGADVHWLMTGQFANSNFLKPSLHGKSLYKEILSNGGKPLLRRVLDTYGFTQQKQLSMLMGISEGTISTWIKRDFFPGDVVVACALDTGVSLQWLATGQGEMFQSTEGTQASNETLKIDKYRMESGKLLSAGHWLLDASLSSVEPSLLNFIEGISHSWLVNTASHNIGNGRWVINIDDSFDVFDVVRLPGGKIKLSNDSVSFECAVNDVKPHGAVIFTLEKNI
ncbi:phage repressor protein CI [Pantoea cypripedii]|uniref:Repressor n=1 Tax=Pantoea cypripedii TaxID=55209 RepID=A0A1X1EXF4_PANCY|nr:phage repressor protein CI [Pantoea cypripedii]MBP2194703.1 transcriptional regulator with XRE-family HTH domain [Pantoea cypripedii]ORM94597.1 repressor [Pantoea cypripedii]